MLTDFIYIQWSYFVLTIHELQREKKTHFVKLQERAKKDVDRAFGILQSRWGIVKNPCRQWELDTMAYIVLHNMIIEDEQAHNLE